MIQRIQSVYLFLALLALGALFSQLPVITVVDGGGVMSATSSTFLTVEEVLIGLSALVTFFSIFAYAKRKRQMMVVKAAIVLTVLAIVAIGADYFVANGNTTEGYVNFDPVSAIAIVALILQWLGHRGIMKDEKLVREADRLR